MRTAFAPAAPPADSTAEPTLLDVLLQSAPPRQTLRPVGPTVGECIDDRHPVLLGRALVRYTHADGGDAERWLAGLHGLAIRTGDRLLLLQPENWPEAIVVGVIDGFAHRPEASAVEAARVSLKTDEVVRVESARGQGLVEVRQGATGPVVRFLGDDVQLDVPGRLGISAKSLDLRATLGGVAITATDDVVVRGEVVKLN